MKFLFTVMPTSFQHLCENYSTTLHASEQLLFKVSLPLRAQRATPEVHALKTSYYDVFALQARHHVLKTTYYVVFALKGRTPPETSSG